MLHLRQHSMMRASTKLQYRTRVGRVRVTPGTPGGWRCRTLQRVSTSSDSREPANTASIPSPTTTREDQTSSGAAAAPSEPPSVISPIAVSTVEVLPPASEESPAVISPASTVPDELKTEIKAEEKAEVQEVKPSEVKSFPVELSEDDMFGTKGLIQELTDQQKFGKRGEAWFFAQALVFLLVLFPPMDLKGLLDFIGTLAISAGLVFMAYALICLGRSLSPLPAPRKENRLVTSGMYGYVRHPMYGGLILVAVGLTLVTGSESRLALSLLLWWILEQKANVEEMLMEKLHPEYTAYKERVKKFIPYIY